MVRRYAYGVQRVSSQIYDINGKLVKNFTPYASRITPYAFTWNAAQHPAGVYTVVLTIGTQKAVKKIFLLK
jgi:flagellar hook assembly protein FlgD